MYDMVSLNQVLTSNSVHSVACPEDETSTLASWEAVEVEGRSVEVGFKAGLDEWDDVGEGSLKKRKGSLSSSSALGWDLKTLKKLCLQTAFNWDERRQTR